MAENDQSQEKTEQPSPRRLQQAQEKGDVASSRELNTTLILLVGSAALLVLGGGIFSRLQAILRDSFLIDRATIFDPSQMVPQFLSAVGTALVMLVPLLGILAVAAVIGPVALGGGKFASKALAPNFGKINPLTGLKRIFSSQGLMEFVKTLLKFTLIAGVAGVVLWGLSGSLLGLGYQDLAPAMVQAGYLLGSTLLLLAAALILVALIDVPFQLWTHQKKLRMTMQEVKDEFKETEGKPEVKSKIRQTQQQLARSRMMAEVPRADVVVTNPTHFAVALRYDGDRMRAPIVVAKGADLVAAEIRERARNAGVPLLSAPVLARALYFSTRLEQEIPAGLYLAVAQVLAYVFQLRSAGGTGAPDAPSPPVDLPVPDELQRTAEGRPV